MGSEATRFATLSPRNVIPHPLRTTLLGLALATVALVRGLPAQSVSGQVNHQETGAPVVGVSVRLMDSAGSVLVVQHTEVDGRFALMAPRGGRYRLRVLAPGYRPLLTPLFDLAAGEDRDYPLTLRPIPPAVLDTVLVEGQAVPWNLVEYYRRRRRGLGNFATREDWERWGIMDVPGVVRHISPFVLQPYARGGIGLFGRCSPVVFLDNLPLGPEFDLNDLFLGNIAAIEVYRSPWVPPEFDRPFGVCAAIALWSRVDSTGPRRAVALGVQAGGVVAGAGGRRDRVGVHALIGFEGLIEPYPCGQHDRGSIGWRGDVALGLGTGVRRAGPPPGTGDRVVPGSGRAPGGPPRYPNRAGRGRERSGSVDWVGVQARWRAALCGATGLESVPTGVRGVERVGRRERPGLLTAVQGNCNGGRGEKRR